jgi:hypothetical protein
LKVKKTSHEESDKEKEDWYFNLTPLERLAHHQKMLQKIYGDRYNQPLGPEALKIKIKRG